MMQISTIVSAVLALAVSLAGCATTDSSMHTGVFTNDTEQSITDLHVEFDVDGVTIKSSGNPGFPSHDVQGKVANMRGGNLGAGAFARVQFEREGGDFRVVQWYWTLDDAQVGPMHTGPPNPWE